MYVNLNKNNPLKLYFYFSLYIIIFLSSSRILFAIWMFDRVDSVNGWFPVLIQGIRIDITTLCFLLAFPVLYSTLTSNKNKTSIIVIRSWLTLVVFLFVFMECSTPSFILEYNIRPNRLFLEYLIYPKEVFAMLIKSRVNEIIIISVVGVLTIFLTWKWLAKNQTRSNSIVLAWRPVVAVLLLLGLALGGRSTLGHRPLNPAMVYFSSDPLVNSLTLNSLYSVLWSARQLMNEESINKIYGTLSENIIIDNVRAFKGQSKSTFTNTEIPSYSKQIPSFQGVPKNLVIILEESLGARFVGNLGGLPLTPNIDRLSKEGINFTRAFATGIRSVRGIEAVITGFTPTPNRSVVKLDKSQRNFFSIATLLKNNNYRTEFIYGGEAHFDNMKSFFLGNGFDHITEFKDFHEPLFVGSWGVSDEDLFNKAHTNYERLSKINKPFFSLIFSSSNHEPFEYPNGRIKQYDSLHNTQNNAIKYADWALGEFINNAKASHYWKNTIFLMIADHDARSQGTDLIPIKSFHIPAIIFGEGVIPYQENKIVSQIDMAPTLLSLIGIHNNSPMIGSDLTQVTSDFNGRALLQNGQNFGYLTEKNITILQPYKKAVNQSINWSNFSLEPVSEASSHDAIRTKSMALWGSLAYKNQLYRLPKNN